MNDKDFSYLNDAEFDKLLTDTEFAPPSADLIRAVNPWRRAMNRILWGLGLTTLTLNFWNLDYILPAIGHILALLGFRALRKENKWFSAGYVLTAVRACWFAFHLFLSATIFRQEIAASTPVLLGTYSMLAVVFLLLLCLRNGIRAVQLKAGLEPDVKSATALLVWDAIMTVLGLIGVQSILVWLLLIAYFCILRGLYKCSKALDEAGYAVEPAPVRLSDRAVKLGYAGAVLLLMSIGYTCFNKYSMDWQPAEPAQSQQVQEIRAELLELGFPETVLNDLTEEEIMACEGAAYVLVEQRDYDMEQHRGIGTQEEIDNGKIALLLPEEGEAHLRTTYIGVKFADERERWRLIHHFEWLVDTDFPGTECIQIWTAGDSTGWQTSSEYSGQVLYDLDGTAYASDYHSLGQTTYENSSPAAAMLGMATSTDVFATYSFPSRGTRHRGYVAYEISEEEDGYIVSSWFNMTHQYSRLQFPVKTAKEFEMTAFVNSGFAFRTIQTALQFTTHEEEPGLI